MSLINDALKRARLTKKSSEDPASDPPLEPVETEPSKSRSSAFLLLALGIVALGAAIMFSWQWWMKPKPAATASSAKPVKTNIVARVKAQLSPIASNRTEAIAVIETVMAPTTKTNAAATSTPSAVAESPLTNATVAANPSSSLGQGQQSTNAVSANSTAATNITASVAPTRSGPFPDLKLQGIYYRLTKPSVLINNKTLYVGDEIEGTRVTVIQRYKVTVEMGGKTKDLSFPPMQ